MNSILVSIIIPCYNVEDYVGECLSSALEQTYRPIEIIVVDNNSTDRTMLILKHFEQLYPGIITILNERKQGACAARNKGIISAKGKWLQFLDADDILLPDKISNQMRLVFKDKVNENFIVGDYYYQLINGMKIRFSFEKKNLWVALMALELGCTCSNLFPKKSVLEVNGWNEDMLSSQEYDLMFRILSLNNYDVCYDNSSSVIVRRRKGSISTAFNQEANYLRAFQLQLKIFHYLRQNKVDDFIKHHNDFKSLLVRHLRDYSLYNLVGSYYYYQNYLPGTIGVNKQYFGRYFSLIFNLIGYLPTVFLYKYYYNVRLFFGFLKF